MKKFIKFFDGISNVVMLIACILLISCAIFVNASVFLRYAFHVSFQWAEELARYLHIGVVVLLFGPLLWTGGHITMDLLLMKLKGAARKCVRIFNEIVTLVLVGYTFYQSIGYVCGLKATGILTFSSKFEQWMPTMLIPIGFFLATLFCVALIIRELVQFKQDESTDESLNDEISDILSSNQIGQIDLNSLEEGEQ